MNFWQFVNDHWTEEILALGYVLAAIVNSSPQPDAPFNLRTLYKWARDTAIVLVNQHRDSLPKAQEKEKQP